MNKVKTFTVAVGAEESLHPIRRNFRVHCLQAREREDRVVKVGASRTILSAAFGCELAPEEIADQFGGITQQPGRLSGHLQELETQTQAGTGE